MAFSQGLGTFLSLPLTFNASLIPQRFQDGQEGLLRAASSGLGSEALAAGHAYLILEQARRWRSLLSVLSCWTPHKSP